MSQQRLPPPTPAPCLVCPYPSSQKGGTLIDETVTDRAEHRRRLCDPDGYRPAECPRCHHRVLHVHDYVKRSLVADAVDLEVTLLRYECASCHALWRILPAFLVRHLWRSWDTVEAVTLSAPPPSSQPPVPKRTVHRWQSRLRSSALALAQLFAATGDALFARIMSALGHQPTRQELVRAYANQAQWSPGVQLLALAALTHRLMPGLRLM